MTGVQTCALPIWCCVRPSGTEPKIKFYFGVKGVSLEDSQAKLDALSAEVLGQFE